MEHFILHYQNGAFYFALPIGPEVIEISPVDFYG
jgi:hypothetical protein